MMVLTELHCADCGAPATHWLGDGPNSDWLGAPVCEPCGQRAIRRTKAAQRATEAYRQRHAPRGLCRWEGSHATD